MFDYLLFSVSKALAVVTRDGISVDDTQSVPVPYNTRFGFGPAGEFTAVGLILGLINVMLAIAGTIAVLFLIIGGFRYITAHGNEEQAEGAKKTIQHAIIGLVVIILSFVIIIVISNALVIGVRTDGSI